MSHSLTDLRWTSRRELCDQIFRFLLSTRPDNTTPATRHSQKFNSLRQWAATVLAALSDGSNTADLFTLLRCPDEDSSIVGLVLQGLQHPWVVLSTSEFAELFRSGIEKPFGFLPLCRTEEHLEVVRPWMASLSPQQRAEILVDLITPEPEFRTRVELGGCAVAPCVVDEFYRQWAEEDRHAPGMDEWSEAGDTPNLRVALAGTERPEARDVLDRYLTRCGSWDAVSVHWVRNANPDTLDYFLSAHRPTFRQFPLPHHTLGRRFSTWAPRVVEALARNYGVDELLLHCEAEIRAGVRERKNPITRRGICLILCQLADPAADELLTSLIACPDVGGLAGSALRTIEWHRFLTLNPTAAFERLPGLLASPERKERHVMAALHQAGAHPAEEARDLLWWSTTQESHPEYAFAGIVGLEKLGEDSSEWQVRLTELTESPVTAVRLLACAALARRGQSSYLEPIEIAARTFSDGWEDREGDKRQGLAIRLLGELEPLRHIGLFQAVVSQTLTPWNNGSPEQEAAFILAQLATPETVTTLLRACFSDSEYLRRLAREYLLGAVARMEGEEVSMVNRIDLWRYSRIPP